VSAGAPKRLGYQPASGTTAEDESLIVGGSRQRPPDLFPRCCCSCLIPTEMKWRSAQGMWVPMCERCRRRWNGIRAGLIVVAMLGGFVLTSLFAFAPSRDRFNAAWWSVVVAAVVLPATLGAGFLVHIVEFLVGPVRSWGERGDQWAGVRFRNRDYHRMARRWMTTDGFPVPPKKLKDRRGGG
jgi:hypothetical protein